MQLATARKGRRTGRLQSAQEDRQSRPGEEDGNCDGAAENEGESGDQHDGVLDEFVRLSTSLAYCKRRSASRSGWQFSAAFQHVRQFPAQLPAEKDLIYSARIDRVLRSAGMAQAPEQASAGQAMKHRDDEVAGASVHA